MKDNIKATQLIFLGGVLCLCLTGCSTIASFYLLQTPSNQALTRLSEQQKADPDKSEPANFEKD